MTNRCGKDLTGRTYEETVMTVLKHLFRGNDKWAFGEWTIHRTFIGASGVEHEADLYLKVPRGKDKDYFLVECKDHGGPVEKKDAAAFSAILKDLNAVRGPGEQFRGMLVSRNGFQSGAEQFGTYYGIRLLEIREPDEKEWERYIRALRKLKREPRIRDLEMALWTNEEMRAVVDWDEIRRKEEKDIESWEGFWPWDEKDTHEWRQDRVYLRDYNLSHDVSADKVKRQAIVSHAEMGKGGRRELFVKVPEGSVLTRRGGYQQHRYGGYQNLPIKGFELTYVDATDEIMEAILYDVEKPDYLIYDPITHERWGLRMDKGVAEPMEDIVSVFEHGVGEQL